MNEYETAMRGKLKKLLYGLGLVGTTVGATLGIERAMLYARNWYAKHKEKEREELAEAVIKKYKASAEQG